MRSFLVQLFSLMQGGERVRFFYVLLAMLMMGILQVAGVGSILTFVSLLSDPEQIQQSAIAQP